MELTRNYREAAGPEAIKARFFGKESIQKILDQAGCVGIRVYFGQTIDNIPELVLVGVDSNENDLTDGILSEKGLPCPPICPWNSPLSGN